MDDVLENSCESPGTCRHGGDRSMTLSVTLSDLNIKRSFTEILRKYEPYIRSLYRVRMSDRGS